MELDEPSRRSEVPRFHPSASLEQLLQQFEDSPVFVRSAPLHQYKLTQPFIANLELLLAVRLSGDSLNLSRAESAGFVLYCAHHFTQSYGGGHWTWETAKGKVDPDNRLGPPLLYKIVERGLSAWGRRVFWNGRIHEYLYTVGREGGLPLSVLAHDRGDRLRGYLLRLLNRVETSTVSAEESAAEFAHHLPVQLRQPEILRLAAELIREISEIRRRVPATSIPSIEWLDEHAAGWRDQLPLRTNDTVAATLIAGLVQQERPKAPEHAFALATLLVNGRLQRTLETPRRFSRRDLVGPNREVSLPTRFRIAVSNGATQSVRAMATRVGDDDEYAVERLLVEPLQGATWFDNEIRLVVGVGGRELATFALPGGEVEGETPLPWVFDTDSSGACRAMARGSYASKSESVIAALPANTGMWNAAPGIIETVGNDNILGWTLTRIRGAAKWSGPQDSCDIVSGMEAHSVRFELKGSYEQLPGTGTFAWRGCPRLYTRSPQGLSAPVPDHQTEWRPTGSSLPWQRLGAHCLGDVQLRIREGDRTLYRARLTVVPVDFRIELSASHTTIGRLRLVAAQVSRARVVTPGIETSVRAEANAITLEIRGVTPPPSLDLEVSFGSSTRLDVQVPFPGEFCGFVSPEGKALPTSGRIGLDQLSTWTARAISCDPTQRYLLEAQTHEGARAIAELSEVSRGVAELPLSRVRAELQSCLSGTRRIDAYIPLRVVRHTGVVTGGASRTQARLGWHETQLDVLFDGEAAIVQLHEDHLPRLAPWEVRDFRVVARPLHEPAADAITLEGKAQDGWFFSPGRERRWLLTGWIGNALATRPRMVQLDALEAAELLPAKGHPASLDVAMRTEPLPERRAALAAAYATLSSDYSSADWSRVDEFVRTLHELPPPTYDVVCALASVKAAAIVTIFRQPPAHFPAVWDGLEQLGVSWHTIPVGIWLRAARLGRDFAFSNASAELFGGKDRLLRHLLSGLLEQLETGPRFFQILLAGLNTYCTGFPPAAQGEAYLTLARTQTGRSLLRQQIRDACVDLRRRVELTNERFPPVRISSHECCPDIHPILASFGLSEQAPFAWECLAAPLVAADAMVNGVSLRAGFLDDLRLLQAFDAEWFEFAHAVALTVLLGKKLEDNDDFFERAEAQLLDTDG